jgi:hypothetical protein
VGEVKDYERKAVRCIWNNEYLMISYLNNKKPA